jgi:hypothetical protein
MAIKELKKIVQPKPATTDNYNIEKKTHDFISKGGRLADDMEVQDGDHRLTLRIPKELMAKVDVKRRERVGKISRNLWILELIEKATRG